MLVPLRASFVDDRGEIKNLLDRPCGSVLIITSVAGAVRGNHYHKTDFHYSWLQRGGLIYYHRRIGDRGRPARRVIKPGQMFYTPPMVEHAMYFTKSSVLIVIARNNRQMRHYESDTARIPSLVAAA